MTGASSLNRLAYFTAVVETGSFTAAAERLGITKAVVSQQVARLESDCRTTLLVRSTRKVRTTEAGQQFYHRCALILKEAEEAFEELSEAASEPTGTLRLTAPFDYGIGVVVPAITAFAAISAVQGRGPFQRPNPGSGRQRSGPFHSRWLDYRATSAGPTNRPVCATIGGRPSVASAGRQTADPSGAGRVADRGEPGAARTNPLGICQGHLTARNG